MNQVAGKVDRAALTLLVSRDADERRFIGEAIIVGSALYLMQRYCAGVLKGMGFDAMAEEHGRRLARFLERLKMGNVFEGDLENARAETDALRDQMVASKPTAPALTNGEREVTHCLEAAGAMPVQAKNVAKVIAEELGRAKRG
jgi:hypothetical protein